MKDDALKARLHSGDGSVADALILDPIGFPQLTLTSSVRYRE